MQTFTKRTFFLLALLSFLSIFLSSPFSVVCAQEKQGWGNDDEYNQYYNSKELDKLKGRVESFKEVEPLPGMSKATVLILDEDGDKIVVHLCPVWFARAKDTGIKRGDKVKIKGSWAEINGKDVFIASKVKKGEHYEFKVRLTADGTPFWNMTLEELANERRQQK